ncbi:MAG: BTAD domain-containing putative transcriptional regulator [Mycobacterium sp.]
MRVLDLGALAVAVDAVEQPVGGSKAAAILAMLVIHANRRVSVEALMDAAWGVGRTSGTVSTLESHIWRLRQLLEPQRPTRQASSILVNEAGGYRLVAAGHSIDSLHFDEIARDARELLTAGSAASALARADEALMLWRGQPYGLFAEHDWARPAVARLDELHSQVQECRIDAFIAIGSHERALADLEPLIAAMPFRERLWSQQMLALYRSGRIEQALGTFQRARSVLNEEIGTDPGPELSDLHRRILDHDASLISGVATPATPLRPVEVKLPPSLSRLVGRDNELSRLSTLVEGRQLVTIVGAAGCGKTRLAVEVARVVAERFSDGVWFIDLGTVDDPSLVIDVIVSTIGFSASPGSTLLEDLTHYLRGRRLLLILDNCEHILNAVAHIVEAAVAGNTESRGCAILATSREPLDIDGETVWTLGPLALPPQGSPGAADTRTDTASWPAVQLFLDRLAAAAPTLEIDARLLQRVLEICDAVDGLPLAIELAAARVRSFSIDDVWAQVAADPSELRRIGRERSDHRATIRSAIEWSYRLMTPTEQIAHRRLAVLPGPFTTTAAAAVVDDFPDTDVNDVLAQLVHRSMLASTATPRPGGITVFSQLATVRAHAWHALSESADADVASRARNQWVIELIEARPRLGSPTEPDWYHRLDDDYATVRAALAALLIDEPASSGARIAPRLSFYWYYRARIQEGQRWLTLANDLSGPPSGVDSVLTALGLGATLAVQGRIDLARQHTQGIVERLPPIPTERLIDIGESLVGMATAAWVRDAIDVVEEVHTALVDVTERAADEQLQLLCDAVGTLAMIAPGRLDEAAVNGAEVYARAIAMNNNTAGWIAAGPPMIAALLDSRPAEGIEWVDRVMQGHLRLDSAAGGMFVETRANFAVQSGEYLQAAQLYAAARTQTRRAAMVWPRRELSQDLLRKAQSRLSPTDYERAWKAGERLTLEEIVQITRS